MQSPLPQLTTILLLVHLGLGCCFHHAHACELGGCELETSQLGDCDCGYDSHAMVAAEARKACDEPPLGITHAGSHAHECSGADCIFIAVRPRVLSHIEEGSHFSSLPAQSLGHVATASQGALFARGTAREFGRMSLPRTHLTLQVWQL